MTKTHNLKYMVLAKTMMQLILAGLFIGCLMQVPYGYYQFVRLASFVLFGVLGYTEYKKRHYLITILCVCSALLFNPIIPVYLERDTWQEIDRIMACLMLLWIMTENVTFFMRAGSKKPPGEEKNNMTKEEMQTGQYVEPMK